MTMMLRSVRLLHADYDDESRIHLEFREGDLGLRACGVGIKLFSGMTSTQVSTALRDMADKIDKGLAI